MTILSHSELFMINDLPMEGIRVYYLKPEHISDIHRRHISEGMLKMYALKGGKRSDDERQHISEGMRRYWQEVKLYCQINRE